MSSFFFVLFVTQRTLFKTNCTNDNVYIYVCISVSRYSLISYQIDAINLSKQGTKNEEEEEENEVVVVEKYERLER